MTDHLGSFGVLPGSEGRRPRSAVAVRELLSTPAVRRERAARHGDGEGLRLRQSPKGEPGQSAHVTAASPGVQVTGRVKPDGPLTPVANRTVNRLTLRGTQSVANMNAIRKRSPLPCSPAPRHNRPYSDAELGPAGAAGTALVADLPRVWHDPRTPARERKRMLRLLIEDVTLLRDRTIQLHIRWKGGATTSLECPIPQGAPDLLR